MVSTLKTINATCANDHLHEAIERRAQANAKAAGVASCFDRCVPKTNRTSDCYILCTVQTVIGRDPFNVDGPEVASPMSSSELAAPLTHALLSDDPIKGGCPALRGSQLL